MLLGRLIDRTSSAAPALSPASERAKDRKELASLFGETVDDFASVLRNDAADKDAVPYEPLEPVGEYVAGNVEALLKVLIMFHALK